MNTQPDNPPAFPVASTNFTADGSFYSARSTPGMTLRDWFAGQALAGLCAAHANPAAIGFPDNVETATKAYDLADAMLRAREGKP